MIYTVTLNPSVDIELTVDKLAPESINCALKSRKFCGGKGINVSRMLANLNTNSIALGFTGGKNGEYLEQRLHLSGIRTDFTWIEGETRTNVSILQEKASEYLKVHDSGPEINHKNILNLTGKVRNYAKPGDWWVLSGSLPPGVSVTIYADLIRIIRNKGARVLLDSSGDALRSGCHSKPDFIKVNLEDARDLIRKNGCTEISDSLVAGQLLRMGPKNVIISAGKYGAMLATGDNLQMVRAPEIKQRNPTGAGNAMTGGIVWGLSRGESPYQALLTGIACSSATASLEGTELGSLPQVLEVISQIKH